MSAQTSQGPGSIFTFYSFKGGVGRSMAMANVAALLARWGQRVLVVDWDLEAPGIEMYFGKWLRGARSESVGVVDLAHGFDPSEPVSWQSGLLKARPPESKPIDILTAGRDDKKFVTRLQELDWEYLFNRGFGNYLEELRTEWTNTYDFILLDSRTGITDIGGICTIHLPDALVAFFTANEQSLVGVSDVLRRAQRSHGELPIDRRRLLMIPVPSRDESNSEYELAQEWRQRFAEELSEFFEDWIPRDESEHSILNYLKIPYHAYWSFGERIPVLEEQDPDNPKTLAFAYQPLARLILGRLNWQEVREGARASEEAEKQAAEAARLRLEAQRAAETAREKSAQKRAARDEKEAQDLQERIDDYLTTRIGEQVDWWREYAFRQSRRALAAGLLMITGLLITSGGLFLYYFSPTTLEPVISTLTMNTVAFVGILAFVLGAFLYVFLRPAWRKTTAGQVAAQLNSEAVQFRNRPSHSEADFQRLIDTVEGIMGRAQVEIDRPRPGESEASEPLEELQLPESFDSAESVSMPEPRTTSPPEILEEKSDDYSWDVFLSYRRSELMDAWLEELMPLLSFWLSESLARDAKVFWHKDLHRGWQQQIEGALAGSRCLLPIWSPTYFQSKHCLAEWQTFQRRDPTLVVPVVFHRGEFPDEAQRVRWFDFTPFSVTGAGFRNSEKYIEFQEQVQELAARITKSIHAAPPFDPEFSIVRADGMGAESLNGELGSAARAARARQGSLASDLLVRPKGKLKE